MEPVLGGRDDTKPGATPSVSSISRNGARPWRTGRHDRIGHAGGDGEAAMEPVLGGRDDNVTTTFPPEL